MRRLAVFSDGTWRKWGPGANTNVVKLYQTLVEGGEEQLLRYDPGVGTNFFKLTGGAFGVGISKNIRDLYTFIVRNQVPGCQLYLFGFSRGAFTVRSLCGMLGSVGIVPKTREDAISEAFSVYKSGSRDRMERFAAEIRSSFEFTIKVIGVWDTVGSLGVPQNLLNRLNPFSHRFHDTHLGKDVELAFHAASVDENRTTFKPTLWTPRKGATQNQAGQTVRQVWFAGVHSDVGGGYSEHQLSDLTLRWMIAQLNDHDSGLEFKPRPDWPFGFEPEPNGPQHDERSLLFRLWPPHMRRIPDGSRIHTSVKERMDTIRTGYRPRNLPDDPHWVGDDS